MKRLLSVCRAIVAQQFTFVNISMLHFFIISQYLFYFATIHLRFPCNQNSPNYDSHFRHILAKPPHMMKTFFNYFEKISVLFRRIPKNVHQKMANHTIILF